MFVRSLYLAIIKHRLQHAKSEYGRRNIDREKTEVLSDIWFHKFDQTNLANFHISGGLYSLNSPISFFLLCFHFQLRIELLKMLSGHPSHWQKRAKRPSHNAHKTLFLHKTSPPFRDTRSHELKYTTEKTVERWSRPAERRSCGFLFYFVISTNRRKNRRNGGFLRTRNWLRNGWAVLRES